MSAGRVRRLRPAEAAAYRALRLDALRLAPRAFGEDHASARALPMLEYANRLEYGDIFGAFAGDALVGCLTYVQERGPKLRHRAWLIGVYLQPAYRGGGLAGEMLDAALAKARADRVRQVELHVSEAAARAHAFYARAGFEKVGRSPRALRVNGIFLDELHMMMRLDGDEGA